MEIEVMGYKHWWLLTLRGLILIGLGIVAIVNPVDTFLLLLVVIGIFLLISGVAISIAAIANRNFFPRWGWTLVQGLVDIIFALVLIFMPTGSATWLAYIFGAWTIVIALLRFIGAVDCRRFGFSAWIWQAIMGAILLVIGILIILNPVTSFATLTILIAIFVIIAGFASIIESVAVKNHQF